MNDLDYTVNTISENGEPVVKLVYNDGMTETLGKDLSFYFVQARSVALAELEKKEYVLTEEQRSGLNKFIISEFYIAACKGEIEWESEFFDTKEEV